MTAARAAARPAPQDTTASLPALVWLWLPVALPALAYALRALDPALERRVFEGELGFVELATFTVLLPGAWFGVYAWRLGHRLPGRALRVWVLMVALGCVYFAGEEVSWGQHLFGWSTPEPVAAINRQGETNIHNIASLFNHRPRHLLELWVFVSVIVWLSGRLANAPAGGAAGWFWPGRLCMPAALMATVVRVPDRLSKYDLVTLSPLFELEFREWQELYLGAFLCLYLLAIHRRLAHESPPPTE